ncbi:hypothetical protein [Actinomyces qiguomingii]|uniref:hypothetical protein n=1 Tax=Actinomyces qiguomingii TaxID=2057800 RepID=UPI000FFF1049|nr:hypothetical protein [Actinomyces qiguomingii]
MTRSRKASPQSAAPSGIVARLRRRATLPPELSALVSADGRVLGAVPLSDDASRWAVATTRFLTVVGRDGVEVRKGWHEVERGRWDSEVSTFTLNWTDDSGPLLLVVPAEISQGEVTVRVDVAPFARALRQGVESALVHSVTGTLPDGKQVTVSVRRDPEGELYLASDLPAHALAGLDARGRAVLAELRRRARDGVGLPTI